MPFPSDAAGALRSLLAFLPEKPAACTAQAAAVRDWSALVRHAEQHGVLGVLYGPLLACSALPADIRAYLEQRRDLERLWNSHLQKTLADVLAALQDAGIRTAVLKGPVLAERLYDDAALRRSTDLDLLVAPGDVDATLNVLQSFEYQPESGATARYHQEFHHHWCLGHARRPPLELHFRLYVGFGVQLGADEFLARAQLYRTQGGSQCYVLSPEDELLYLCLHAAGHDFARLGWLYDLKVFLQRHSNLDWPTGVARANSLRVATALAFTGQCLHERLQVAQPQLLALAAGRHHRLRWARCLLGLRQTLAETSRPGKLLSLVLQASLCDRFSSGGWLLRHHLARSARRTLQRRWPRWFPAEWSA